MKFVRSIAEGADGFIGFAVGWQWMGAWQADRLAMDTSNKGRIHRD